MAVKLFVVTHGETALDREGRMHGWKVDAPLSSQGRLTAQQVAGKLAGKKISKIYSSPLTRAQETAEILGKQLGVPVEMHPDLMPWNIASMGGAKTATIKPLLDFFSTRPHRAIPGGESKNQFLDRYKRFIDRMRKQKGNFAVVAHSQHSLGLDHVTKGGDAGQVPVVGGKPGDIRSIAL